MYLPVPRGLGDGGKLPGLHEDGRQQAQNRGDLAGHGIQAVGLGAQKPGDHIPVRHTGDPPENRGRDQGNAVAEHGLGDAVVRLGHQKLPQLFPQHQIPGADAVGHHHGHDVAEDSQPEHLQKEDIEPDHQGRVKNALASKEGGLPLRPDVLGAEAVEAGGQGVGADQLHIFVEPLTSRQQRPRCQQDQRSQQDGVEPGGEDALAVLLPVQGEAKHAVGNAQGGHRQQ